MAVEPSKRQAEEIEFLSNKFEHFNPTEYEVTEFIEVTCKGSRPVTVSEMFAIPDNRLLRAKRMLDISVKMWRQGIRDGILTITEIATDPELECPYLNKILNAIHNNIQRAVLHGGKSNIG